MRMYADRPSDEPDAAGPDTGRFGAHHAGGRVARLGRKIADFRIRPIRMRGTARRAERDITRPLRRAAACNGAELAVVRTCSTRRFLWGRSHTAAGTLLTLRDCDAPYYAADSILPRYYSEGERKRDIRYQHTMEAQRKRDENLRADRRAPAHAFTLGSRLSLRLDIT